MSTAAGAPWHSVEILGHRRRVQVQCVPGQRPSCSGRWPEMRRATNRFTRRFRLPCHQTRLSAIGLAPNGTQFRCALLFPLPQLTFNGLEARSTGGGFRGRATIAELVVALNVGSAHDFSASTLRDTASVVVPCPLPMSNCVKWRPATEGGTTRFFYPEI